MARVSSLTLSLESSDASFPVAELTSLACVPLLGCSSRGSIAGFTDDFFDGDATCSQDSEGLFDLSLDRCQASDDESIFDQASVYPIVEVPFFVFDVFNITVEVTDRSAARDSLVRLLLSLQSRPDTCTCISTHCEDPLAEMSTIQMPFSTPFEHSLLETSSIRLPSAVPTPRQNSLIAIDDACPIDHICRIPDILSDLVASNSISASEQITEALRLLEDDRSSQNPVTSLPDGPSKIEGIFKDRDLSLSEEPDYEQSLEDLDASDLFPNFEQTIEDLGLGLGPEVDPHADQSDSEEIEELLSDPINAPQARYLRSLRLRGERRYSTGTDKTDVQKLFDPVRRHQKQSSDSSSMFVRGMKSATISVATSFAGKSRRTGISSSRLQDRSSNAERQSEDCSFVELEVRNRQIVRRRIIDELIATERGYLADIKFLLTVYSTFLNTLPTLSVKLRRRISTNLNEIVQLHDALLVNLYATVPNSEYNSGVARRSRPLTKVPRHTRHQSTSALPDHIGDPRPQEDLGFRAAPNLAAAVAKVFGDRLKHFFVYEEYGAIYESMLKDLSTTYRTMPQWEGYEKGLEALASALASIQSQHEYPNKAMRVGDLLVKPMQRICKYPLLFAELLKQTPVVDCPQSHLEIENVLVRLRETTSDINRATDDPQMKVVIERTWLLQDRLEFPGYSNTHSKRFSRTLGHIHLCGALHVAWQTRDGVDGRYMICLLYRERLLLATASKNDHVYTVQACIGANEIKIENADNGRGLQCHTAPFSWKLVFEVDHRLFEIIMSACTQEEEQVWRDHLEFLKLASENVGADAASTSLSLSVKPMGTVFGKPGSLARRISIHRATTVGGSTTAGLSQVIIKNTDALHEPPSGPSITANISRSQSLWTPKRTNVLAPSRDSRVKIESLLNDVWSKEELPLPGMSMSIQGMSRARNDISIRTRTSASSIMRKISKASIASNFSKRSASVHSLPRSILDDESLGQPDVPKRMSSRREPSHDQVHRDTDELPKPRLSVIPDEKENYSQDSLDKCITLSKRIASGTLTFPPGPVWEPAPGTIPLFKDLEAVGESHDSLPALTRTVANAQPPVSSLPATESSGLPTVASTPRKTQQEEKHGSFGWSKKGKGKSRSHLIPHLGIRDYFFR